MTEQNRERARKWDASWCREHHDKPAGVDPLCGCARCEARRAALTAILDEVEQASRVPANCACYVCRKPNAGEHGHETIYLCPEHTGYIYRLETRSGHIEPLV